MNKALLMSKEMKNTAIKSSVFPLQAHIEVKTPNMKAFEVVTSPQFVPMTSGNHPLTRARLCFFCTAPPRRLLFHASAAAPAPPPSPVKHTARMTR